ncbi:SARP family transcriptional regulator [Virgisporangium aurantiacum]|uniref:SARP family transcriptional regulator n=2 Tax=Virgisporangium aurantiacum TaxID=175570 RepID=A0A8J4DX97_9ACTN|nr:SARP family transcriptional regulator [Virgisporangium aurantiacum]
MRFRLLGPMRIREGTTWVSISAAQQRLVLAVLLAEAGAVVSTERLGTELWGDAAPKEAQSTLRGYIMRLRRALGGTNASRLITRGQGYELVVADDDLDAVVFERSVVAGHRALAEGSPSVALDHLDAGLALWRGAALADVPASPTVTLWASRLTQSRISAIEERAAALLALDRPGEVADELGRLVLEHPLRERLWELLMLALRAGGRRADALAAYQQARRALVDELGLEPGAALRDLQRRILAEQTTGPATGPVTPPVARKVVPAQLPAAVAGFTGRDLPLKQLNALLPDGSDKTPVLVLSTITGTAGIGKTALAVHWAHQVRDRFPDGQLYVNLHGYESGAPLRPIDVLSSFLPALGVAPDAVPPTLEAASALYRTLLADRRMLVVLDNARHPDQVRPLLPGGAGCFVLITSRDSMGSLVARDGATRLALDVLTPGEARDLLEALLGRDRIGAEPAAAARLAEVCGHLPLALRIAAANMERAGSIGAYVAQLAAGDPLSALEPDGDPEAGVRAAFEHSYALLPPAPQAAFRLFGLVPGPDVSAPAMAAMARVPVADAARSLARLAAAGLLDAAPGGRYGAHDLMRRFAAQLATDTEDGALDRLMEHYVRGADAAADLLYPMILRLPPDPADAEPAPFATDLEASAWLDAERGNLVAAVRHAADHGPRRAAWRLADSLRGFLYLRMHVADWEVVGCAALRAAEAEGALAGQAAARLSLGLLYVMTGRYDDAVAGYTAARAACRDAGWPSGEAAALGNLGNVHLELDRLDEAAETYAESLEMHRRTGVIAGEAGQLANLALVQGVRGELRASAENLVAALDLHRRLGSRVSEGRNLANLGDAYLRLGRLSEATAAVTEALAVHRELGDRRTESSTMCVLAAVHRDAGRLTEALDAARGAMARTGAAGWRPYDRAEAVLALAGVQKALGETGAAYAGYREGVALAREIGNRYMETVGLIGLAEAAPVPERGAHAREALTLARDRGYRMLAGNALNALAAAEQNAEAAFALAGEALAVHAETGHRSGEARAHELAAQTAPTPAERAEHQGKAAALTAAILAP